MEGKNTIRLGPHSGDLTAVDGVNDGAGVCQIDALTGAIRSTGPSGVHQPDPSFVLSNFLR